MEEEVKESPDAWQTQEGWRASSGGKWNSRQHERCHTEVVVSSQGSDRAQQEDVQRGPPGPEMAEIGLMEVSTESDQE